METRGFFIPFLKVRRRYIGMINDSEVVAELTPTILNLYWCPLSNKLVRVCESRGIKMFRQFWELFFTLPTSFRGKLYVRPNSDASIQHTNVNDPNKPARGVFRWRQQLSGSLRPTNSLALQLVTPKGITLEFPARLIRSRALLVLSPLWPAKI